MQSSERKPKGKTLTSRCIFRGAVPLSLPVKNEKKKAKKKTLRNINIKGLNPGFPQR
jgi:hypothetical protein